MVARLNLKAGERIEIKAKVAREAKRSVLIVKMGYLHFPLVGDCNQMQLANIELVCA